MQYVEISLEEAMKKCYSNVVVLVAIQNLGDDNTDILFVKKRKADYADIFKDIKTSVLLYDDLVKQLRLFTEKQNIHDIKPFGLQKIILLKE